MSLGVTNFQMLPRARQTISTATSFERRRTVSANRSRTRSAGGLPKRMMHSPTVFPGEDAPGTGLRHFPEDVIEETLDDSDDVISASSHLNRDKEGNFQYKTTKQCYEEFPAMVHSGFLLNPLVVEQDVSELEEGPQTGNRRRPGVIDEEDRRRPRFPGEKQSPEGYLRELLTRRG